MHHPICVKVSTTMYAKDLGKLQSVLVSAMRCLDCRDPRCVQGCPEHIDVRSAMQVIVERAPENLRRAWSDHPDDATRSAMDGVEASFEAGFT